MSERVACTKCSTLILQSTGAETGGVCIPCQRGYRHQIEESKLRQLVEKKYEQSPARKHWLWLVEHVHGAPDGYESLSAPNQSFFAVGVLEHDVYRGGFESYFFNSSANHYVRAVNTLMEVGATSALRLVIDAKEALFGSGPLPASNHARRAHLQTHHDPTARAQKLAAIDALFWKDPDELQRKMEAFAERHKLRRPFDD